MRTAYCEMKRGGLMAERRYRRSRTEARRRKLVRVRENIGAAMMLLGFLFLMVIGGAEDLTVIFLGGFAGLGMMLLGGCLSIHSPNIPPRSVVRRSSTGAAPPRPRTSDELPAPGL